MVQMVSTCMLTADSWKSDVIVKQKQCQNVAKHWSFNKAAYLIVMLMFGLRL